MDRVVKSEQEWFDAAPGAHVELWMIGQGNPLGGTVVSQDATTVVLQERVDGPPILVYKHAIALIRRH